MVLFGRNCPGGSIWELPVCGVLPRCEAGGIDVSGGFPVSLGRGGRAPGLAGNIC